MLQKHQIQIQNTFYNDLLVKKKQLSNHDVLASSNNFSKAIGAKQIYNKLLSLLTKTRAVDSQTTIFAHSFSTYFFFLLCDTQLKYNQTKQKEKVTKYYVLVLYIFTAQQCLNPNPSLYHLQFSVHHWKFQAILVFQIQNNRSHFPLSNDLGTFYLASHLH